MFVANSLCSVRFLRSRNLCKYPKMFFATLGFGLFCYSLFYALVTGLVDCDLELAFYERFGKSIRKYRQFLWTLCRASLKCFVENYFYCFSQYSYKLVIDIHLSCILYFIGRLKGKVVFITGASSGIGEHTAIALARYGVRLVLTARRKDELERVKASCIGEQ